MGKEPVWYAVALATGCLFAVLSLANIRQPIAQDDLTYLIAAETLYSTGTALHFSFHERMNTYSPELYLQLVVGGFRLWGASEPIARIPGVVSGLLSLVLVFLITRTLVHGSVGVQLQWATMVCLLYAVTPGFIQSVHILDIDNTILVPSVLLLCWSFMKCLQEPRIGWATLTSAAMAGSLWGRVTTPTVLGAVLGAVALIVPGPFRRKLVPEGALLAGASLFLVSWYLYCLSLDVPFSGPFRYAARAFGERVQMLAVPQLFQNVLYFTLWVGVFPTLWLVILLAQRGRALFEDRRVSPEDVFLLAGLSLALGYLFIGGAIFGFPKYQMPAIPLLYLFGAVTLSKTNREPLTLPSRQLWLILFGILLACAVQVFIAADWIYLVRYRMREALALGKPDSHALVSETALRVGLCALAYGLLSAGLLRWVCRSAAGVLFVLSLGSNLGVVLLQSAGDYQTGYNYGGRGTVEVARYIRDRVPADSVVIVPNEVTYYLRMPNSPYWPHFIWAIVEELARRLGDPRTSALALSIATNTIRQVRIITQSPVLHVILDRDYEQATVGSYTVWIRRSTAGQVRSRAPAGTRSEAMHSGKLRSSLWTFGNGSWAGGAQHGRFLEELLGVAPVGPTLLNGV